MAAAGRGELHFGEMRVLRGAGQLISLTRTCRRDVQRRPRTAFQPAPEKQKGALHKPVEEGSYDNRPTEGERQCREPNGLKPLSETMWKTALWLR